MIVTFQTGELAKGQCLFIQYFFGTFCQLDAGTLRKWVCLKIRIDEVNCTTSFFEWPKHNTSYLTSILKFSLSRINVLLNAMSSLGELLFSFQAWVVFGLWPLSPYYVKRISKNITWYLFRNCTHSFFPQKEVILNSYLYRLSKKQRKKEKTRMMACSHTMVFRELYSPVLLSPNLTFFFVLKNKRDFEIL